MGKVKYFVFCLIVAAVMFLNVSPALAMTNANDDRYVNTAKPESTVPWEYSTDGEVIRAQTMATSSKIADISKWQGKINWKKASKALDLVVIRTQYGTSTEDYMHKSYEKSAIKYKVPFGVYSYVQASTPANARKEARAFYKRASKSTKFYVLDVEEFTNKKPYSMRKVIEAYVDELEKHTDKKIGLYVANHLYTKLNLKMSDFDFVWIPRYSSKKPTHKYHLWQYTSKGRVPGINGDVDLNRLAPGVKLDHFTNHKVKTIKTANKVKVNKSVYYTTNPKRVVTKVNMKMYKKSSLTGASGTLKKGTIVTVRKIVNNKVPRLLLTNGKYVTANKKYVLKVNNSIRINDYYLEKDQVKAIVLKTNTYQYNTPSFTMKTRSKAMKKNTMYQVKSVAYTPGGTPILRLTNGKYVTAKKSIVQKVYSANIAKDYYMPTDQVKHIVLKKEADSYRSPNFTDTTRSSVKLPHIVERVSKVEYAANGIPRLKLADGKYISANKKMVLKLSANIDDYYTSLPTQIISMKSLVVYDQEQFNDETGQYVLQENMTIPAVKIIFSNDGTTKFMLDDGNYVTAEKAAYYE
ncbi:DUF5776 domain-containing protein [Kurthia senegalensis]|uniref:DUF5776 domain-containing protein n=1 Tax=Kurthia senegalensis TaxID=1033740 RepID=UPI000288D508|nr:DUF5776 domain-containing protein [Kurthia senegalensis]